MAYKERLRRQVKRQRACYVILAFSIAVLSLNIVQVAREGDSSYRELVVLLRPEYKDAVSKIVIVDSLGDSLSESTLVLEAYKPIAGVWLAYYNEEVFLCDSLRVEELLSAYTKGLALRLVSSNAKDIPKLGLGAKAPFTLTMISAKGEELCSYEYSTKSTMGKGTTGSPTMDSTFICAKGGTRVYYMDSRIDAKGLDTRSAMGIEGLKINIDSWVQRLIYPVKELGISEDIDNASFTANARRGLLCNGRVYTKAERIESLRKDYGDKSYIVLDFYKAKDGSGSYVVKPCYVVGAKGLVLPVDYAYSISEWTYGRLKGLP